MVCLCENDLGGTGSPLRSASNAALIDAAVTRPDAARCTTASTSFDKAPAWTARFFA